MTLDASAGFFGTLVDHTGVFGEAERFAAAAQGADRTMFSEGADCRGAHSGRFKHLCGAQVAPHRLRRSLGAL